MIVGIVVYGATAIGRAYLMKSEKLSTLAVIYWVSCITLLAILSVFVFHEKINILEIIGIIMGIWSIVLLYKFA